MILLKIDKGVGIKLTLPSWKSSGRLNSCVKRSQETDDETIRLGSNSNHPKANVFRGRCWQNATINDLICCIKKLGEASKLRRETNQDRLITARREITRRPFEKLFH